MRLRRECVGWIVEWAFQRVGWGWCDMSERGFWLEKLFEIMGW